VAIVDMSDVRVRCVTNTASNTTLERRQHCQPFDTAVTTIANLIDMSTTI